MTTDPFVIPTDADALQLAIETAEEHIAALNAEAARLAAEAKAAATAGDAEKLTAIARRRLALPFEVGAGKRRHLALQRAHAEAQLAAARVEQARCDRIARDAVDHMKVAEKARNLALRESGIAQRRVVSLRDHLKWLDGEAATINADLEKLATTPGRLIAA